MEILELENIDNQIIDLLLADGRMSYSDIGERVGLTRVAVKNRIKNLEQNGVIRGYKAVINPVAKPDMTAFVLNVETDAEAFDPVKAALGDMYMSDVTADDIRLAPGPVANDDVYTTFTLYTAGVLTKEQTIAALKVKKLYNQLVLTSEEALSYLRFIGTVPREDL